MRASPRLQSPGSWPSVSSIQFCWFLVGGRGGEGRVLGTPLRRATSRSPCLTPPGLALPSWCPSHSHEVRYLEKGGREVRVGSANVNLCLAPTSSRQISTAFSSSWVLLCTQWPPPEAAPGAPARSAPAPGPSGCSGSSASSGCSGPPRGPEVRGRWEEGWRQPPDVLGQGCAGQWLRGPRGDRGGSPRTFGCGRH